MSNLLRTIAKNKTNGWITSQMINELINPNKILKEVGNSIGGLTDLRTDTHLSSLIQSRKSGILSLEWDIITDGQDSSDNTFLYNIFNNLNINNIISEILEAPLYGYKFLEIVWRYENNRLIPKDVIGKPCEWFTFDNNNIGYFIDNKRNKHFASQLKFLLVNHNASYNNPFGESLLSKCFWPIFFKKEAMKLWAFYLDKYSSPYLIGEFVGVNQTPNKEVAEEFGDAMNDLRQSGIMVLGLDQKVTPLDLSHADSSNIYKQFILYYNSEMSKAILSQTLTTEQSDTGSYAMSQTHLQVRSDIIDADKKLVEETFNELIKKIYYLNFNQKDNLPKFRLYEQEDVDLILSQRDGVLASQTGIKFTKEYFKSAYGFKDTDFDIAETQPQQFTEHLHEEIEDDDVFNDLIEANKKLLNKAISIIENSKDIDTAKSELIDKYKELDNNEIEELFNTALLASQFKGTLDADV